MKNWLIYWFVDSPMGIAEQAFLVLEHRIACFFNKADSDCRDRDEELF